MAKVISIAVLPACAFGAYKRMLLALRKYEYMRLFTQTCIRAILRSVRHCQPRQENGDSFGFLALPFDHARWKACRWRCSAFCVVQEGHSVIFCKCIWEVDEGSDSDSNEIS